MAAPASATNTTAPTTTGTGARKPLYEGSTQYRRWRFSPAQLSQKRESLNRAAVEAIRAAFESDTAGSSATISFLTPGEELLLVKLYISKVTQLCGLFHFPEEVEATAVSYLKRFYLNNTVMDWHPKNVMLTALFLATKTTNHPISLETYTSHIPKTEPSDVLDLEFLVAQSLNFEFTVWHAHRALWGMYLDLQKYEEVGIEELKEVYEKALKHTRASRMTDAELIYTPSQIAMGALFMETPGLVMRWIQDGSGGSETRTTMVLIVEQIKEMIIQEGVEPDVEAVREVDKRLRLCKNPERVVGSKAYLAKKAEEEAKAKEKRERKAEDVKRRMSDEGDVFGDELNRSSSYNRIDDDD